MIDIASFKTMNEFSIQDIRMVRKLRLGVMSDEGCLASINIYLCI